VVDEVVVDPEVLCPAVEVLLSVPPVELPDVPVPPELVEVLAASI